MSERPRTSSNTVEILARVLLALFVVSFTLPSSAQLMDQGKPLGASAQGEMPAYLKDAGVVERLHTRLPLEAVFTDDQGHAAPLAADFDHRPVALALVYYRCAMLCPQVLHGLALSLKETSLAAGKDYNVIVVSISPEDTTNDAAVAKRQFLVELGQTSPAAQAGVHFLTGQPPAIAAIASATGFHYVMVPGPDGKMDQYAHASVVMFATPEGILSEYLSGIDYPSRDVRLAIVDASGNRIATAKDLFLIYCCNYVPAKGRYTVAVVRILALAGMATVAAIVAAIFLLSRKPRPVAA